MPSKIAKLLDQQLAEIERQPSDHRLCDIAGTAAMLQLTWRLYSRSLYNEI